MSGNMHHQQKEGMEGGRVLNLNDVHGRGGEITTSSIPQIVAPPQIRRPNLNNPMGLGQHSESRQSEGVNLTNTTGKPHGSGGNSRVSNPVAYPYPFPSMPPPSMPSLPGTLQTTKGCEKPMLHYPSSTQPSGMRNMIRFTCGCTIPVYHPSYVPPQQSYSGGPLPTSTGDSSMPLYTRFVNPPCKKPKKKSKTGKKRRRCHCKKACMNCRKAHTACDNNRPCGRCQSRGLTCMDEEDLSKPKKKLKTDNTPSSSIKISTIMNDNFNPQKSHHQKDPTSPVCYSNPSFKGIEESINELKEVNQLYSRIIFRLLDDKETCKKEIETDFRTGLTRIKMKEKLSLAIPVSIWDSNFNLITFNELFKKTLYVPPIPSPNGVEMNLESLPPPPISSSSSSMETQVAPPPPPSTNDNDNDNNNTVRRRIEDFLFFGSEGEGIMRQLIGNEDVRCFKIINVWKNRERQFDFVKSDFFRSRCGKYFWGSHLVVSQWDRCVCLNESECKASESSQSQTNMMEGGMKFNRENFILNQEGFKHGNINMEGINLCCSSDEDEDEDLDDENERLFTGKRRKRKKKI